MPARMASARPTLKVVERTEFGTRTTRRLRRTGVVPGIVYTTGEDARAFQVDGRELRHFLHGGATLFDLEIEGQDVVPVVVKDEQRHPVRGETTHIDLHQVRLDREIESDVTVILEGVDDAPGVKEGGIMDQVSNEITIRALPTEIPEQITIDVSEMVIGDTIQLESVAIPAGVTWAADDPSEVTIATLNPPPVEPEPDEEVEEETELVGEDGEPIEAEADGEDGGEDATGDGGDSGDDSSSDDG